MEEQVNFSELDIYCIQQTIPLLFQCDVRLILAISDSWQLN